MGMIGDMPTGLQSQHVHLLDSLHVGRPRETINTTFTMLIINAVSAVERVESSA